MPQDNPSVGRHFFSAVRKTLNLHRIFVSRGVGSALIALSLLAVMLTGAYSGFGPQQVVQAQTPNTTLNFQARILNLSGSLVPDGDYNLEFKIYDTVSSGGTAQGACSGNCLWMETRTGGNTVRVVNGYVSVNLGSVTAFPSNMPWGNNLYITMRVGGTGTPSWDTQEMTNSGNRMKMSVAPVAFVANNVQSGSTNSASTNSSNIVVQSGNALGTSSNSGNITIDSGTATGTTGTIVLGATNASGITLGRTGLTTSNAGALSVAQLLTASGGATIATGSTFTNASSSLFTAQAVADKPSGGNIGTAVATVDVATTFNVNQTTASQTLTLPTPTNTTAGRLVFINNVGTASFVMYGTTIGAGASNSFMWNGSSWITSISLSGSVVNTIGSIDAQTKSANGAVISGNAIYLQTADASSVGLVSTGTQTFAGAKTFNGSVTLAASQSLTITGGNTASRPGSPTEGMVYFDTTTKQLLVYANGKWQADRSTATVIVADGNTTSSSDSADFVVPSGSTSAQTTINNAIAALPTTGGVVLLREGTYLVDGSIVLPSNITLSGTGPGTIIKIKNALNASIDVIVNSDTSGSTNERIVISNLRLDGNKSNNTSGTQNGINLSTVSSRGTGKGGSLIHNVYSEKFRNYGLYVPVATTGYLTVQGSNFNQNGVAGIYTSCDTCVIDSNTIAENATYGIHKSSGSGATISNNNIYNNPTYGVYIGAGSTANRVVGNNIAGSSSASSYGVYLLNTADNVVVTNNRISGYSYGVYAAANTVNANIANNTITGFSTGRNAIYLDGASRHTVESNTIIDQGDTYDAIYLTGTSSNNTISDNKIYSSRTSGNAIALASGATSNYLSGNTFSGTGATAISDSGTNTVYAGQSTSANGENTKFRQANSSTAFAVQNASGTSVLNVDTSTAGVAVTGTLSVSGLATFNGGATITTGQTFTVNGDGFTDLTGSGLTISGGALTVDTTSATGAFINGGNTFSGASTLGNNNNAALNFETNNTTRLTIQAGGNISATGQLLLDGTGSNQSQFIVRANSGQTVANPLVLLQNSSAAELARINATTTSLYFGNAAGGNSAAGANNTGIGASALGSVSTGTGNTTLGSGALASVSVNSNNTAVGYNAGTLSTGSNNIFLGQGAGANATTGDNNIIIGTGLNTSSAGVSNELRIGGVLQGNTSTLAAQFNGDLTVNNGTGSADLLIIGANSVTGNNANNGQILIYGEEAGVVNSTTLTSTGGNFDINSGGQDIRFLSNNAVSVLNGKQFRLYDSAGTSYVSLTQGSASTLTVGVGGSATTVAFNPVINANAGIVVAAGQSLTVTGGNTASRPGSPTEGMVYYDTTTKQLLTYANGKWQADRSTATKIVAASNSSQAVKDAADYVATGSGDQATINTALTAAAGGKVYLSEGTYSVTAAISVPNDTILSGSGSGTIITIPNAQNGSYNIIENTDQTTGTGVVVRDLKIDGNRTNQTSGNMMGIHLINMGGGSGSSGRNGGKILNNTVNNIYGLTGGTGIKLTSSLGTIIEGNTTIYAGSYGMQIVSSTSISILGNTVQGNGLGVGPSAGIFVNASNYVSVENNVLETNGTAGIGSSGDNNTISGNTVNAGGYGITLNTGADYNTVTNNTILNTTLIGIRVNTGTYNIISSNSILNSGTSTDNNAIHITLGDYNSISNNVITDTSGCTTTCFAINISDAASDKNSLSGNRFTGSAANAASINDAGTNTIYEGQQTNSTTSTNSDVSDFRFRGSANSSTAFAVQNASGTSVLNVDTSTAGVAVTGTLSVSGLATFNGGATITTGQTFTVNGDGFTDLTGSGLTISSGALTVDSSSATGFFRNGGNSFGAGAVLGTNDNNSLVLRTNSTAALTIDTSQNASFAGNITVAAGKSITLTGGNTASRPGSPTEGMVYYDTTTKQLLVYANGKWQADRSTATKIVAASNSSQAVKDAADYVASGSGDQATINSALTAAAGGKVYLSEGTYTISASISIPNNTTLAGAGTGSIITIPNSYNADIDAIVNTDSTTGTGVVIRDLVLDGNRTNQASNTMRAIVFTNMGGGSGTSARPGGQILNNIVKNWYATAGANGAIQISAPSSNNIISGNTILNNLRDGIQLQGSYNNFTGNLVQGSGNIGIVSGSTFSSITSNTVQGNAFGIYQSGGSNATISSNTVQANTAMGIRVSASSNNLVSSNNIIDNGNSTTNVGIYLSTADFNRIINNYITDTSCTTTCVAIDISDAASDKNTLSGNSFTGSAANAASINDAGTGTIYQGQQTNSTTSANSDVSDFRFRGSANSSTAFAVQNASGTSVLNVNTSTAGVSVTGTLAVSGLATFNGGATITTGQTFTVNGDGFTDLTGSGLVLSGSSLAVDTAAGTGFIQNQSASAQTGNFFIQSSSSGAVGAQIRGASGQTANIFEVRDSSGNFGSAFDQFGNLQVRSSSRLLSSVVSIEAPTSSNQGIIIKGAASQSADYIQFQNSSGTSIGSFDANAYFRGAGIGSTVASKSLLMTNQSNGSIEINTQATTNVGLVVKGVASQTAALQQYQDSSGNVLSSITSIGALRQDYSSGVTLLLDTASTINNQFQGSQGGKVVLAVKGSGVSAQTADLLQFQNSSGTILGTFNASGNLGLGTTSAPNKLNINSATTADATAQALISTGGTANKGLVVQGVAGQATEYFQVQDSTGTSILRVNSAGLTFAQGISITGTSAGNSILSVGSTPSIVNTIIRGASGQTADNLQVQDSTASNLFRVDATGNVENLGYTATPFGGIGRGSNSLTFSEAFDNAAWTKTNVTAPTANTIVSPDTVTSAESLATSSAGGSVSQTTAVVPTNANYTFSVWLKTASGTQAVDLRIDGSTSGTGTAKTVTATTTWQRFSITQNTNGFTGFIKPMIFPGGTAGSGTVHAWGAQLLLASDPGVYIATGSGVVNSQTGIVTNKALYVASSAVINAGLTVNNGAIVATVLGTADTSTYLCRNTTNQIATCSVSPLSSSLTDNITDALDIQEGTNNYINVNTTNGSENISFGNATTNPSFNFLGGGTLTVAGATTVNGLLTANAGATVSGGTVNINASSNNNTNINTGTSTGTVAIGNSASTTTVLGTTNINTTGTASTSIGNATGTLALTSNAFNVTTAGALSGITTLSMSGAITAATSSNTINGLIINAGALSGVTGLTSSGAYTQSGTSANTFTGATTFSAAGTALSVTNNASIGGTLAVTTLGTTDTSTYLCRNSSNIIAGCLGSPLSNALTDNIVDAFDLQEGTNNYININTTNASENISFGNATTNPSFNFLGTGTLAVAGATTISGTLTVGPTAGSTATLTVNGATKNATLALGDFATGGSIGSAGTTVDIYTSFAIGQTTTGQTLTVPAPTDSTGYGRVLYVSNIGTASFTIVGQVVAPGTSVTAVWSNTSGGASWQTGGTAKSGGAASTVSTSASGGASSAVASKNPFSADFINSSTTSAQTVINTALTAVGNAGGGTVVLMEGTYIIDGSINIPNNVTLSGSGLGTIIKLKNGINATIKAITNTDTTTGTKVGVSNLKVDGNKANQTLGFAVGQNGIYFDNVGSSTRDGGRITNVEVSNMAGNTSATSAITLINSSNNTIIGSLVSNNDRSGIKTTGTSASNTIYSNKATSNRIGFELSGSGSDTINSNVTNSNTAYGFYLNSNFIALSGNTSNSDNSGIYVSGANSVNSNTIFNSTVYGIELPGQNNDVSGNYIYNSGGSTANNAIFVTGNANKISNNYTLDGSCTTTCFAINISSGSKNSLEGNRMFGDATNPGTINDAGTNTAYINQQVNGTNSTNNDVTDYRLRGTANSTTAFAVQDASGTSVLNVNTSTAGLSVTGTLAVSGLASFNGGLTVATGQNFTVNGDVFTDLTGSGLTVSSGALTVDATSATGFFRNGGNSFGATASLGTADANALSVITGNTQRLIFANGNTIYLGNADASGNAATPTSMTIASASSSTTGGTAGNVTIQGGNALVGSGGTGGSISLLGGSGSSTGGAINLTTSTAGNINLTSGSGSGLSAAGNINITTGGGSGSGASGTLNLTTGTGSGTISGGPMNLTTGGGGTGTLGGGLLKLQAGNGGSTAAANGPGGSIQLIAGAATSGTSNGGSITLTAGVASTTGTAGTISLISGAGVAGSNTNGGTVNINTGVGGGSGAGGTLNVIAGAGGASGAGGALNLTSGAGNGASSGGLLSVQGGTGGATGAGGQVTVAAGVGGATSGAGGLLVLQGGSAQAGNSNGGNISLIAGNSTGTGTTGTITLTSGSGVAASNTAGGSLNLNSGAGGGSAAGGTLNVTAGAGGATGAGGALTVRAGAGGATSGNGGLLTLQGGNATAGASNGGGVSILAGQSTTTGTAGTISITAGAGVAASNTAGGTLSITSGAGGGTAAGGTLTVLGGQGGATGIGGAVTVRAGAGGATSGAGGLLTLQGGNATAGNTNGGNVALVGGTGTGTGVKGLVVIDTPTFQTATVQNFTGNGTITQANIDSNGAILLSSNAAGYVITMPDPTLSTTSGRLVYVTNTGSFDMTLSINGGGAGNTITLKPNTTATMVWRYDGSVGDWTAAGASSSTDLQAAYNNTATSAGGAELILNAPGGSADGLTIRNNGTTPIIGGLLEVQSSIGSNLFTVNNNATEFANNGGAESTTFTMWTGAFAGGTVTRNTTATNVATGQGSVSVVTTATIGHGAENLLSTTLTPNLKYAVSYTVKGTSNFTTLETVYTRDGTNTSTTQCNSAQTVTTSQFTRISCTFTAPATGITASNGIFIRQTDATARTFFIDNLSVTVSADVNHAADGSVDSALGTNWTDFGANTGGTTAAIRNTTVLYDTSGSVEKTTGATASVGIVNNLSINPTVSTQYLVTFYARSSNTFNDIRVRYSRDGGTNFVTCADYNTQTVSTTTYTKITCIFTTDGTTATNADLIIDQPTATARTFYVDALTVTLNTNNSNNVQIGGGSKGGPTTLFTLDRSAGNPIAANNDAYLGSMYYDTTTGRIQCYEADGWGACGAAPDNIVNLNPEYAGAVLNGSGVGTMTADFCSNDTALSVNSTLCGTGEAKNYYKWTSPQATQQTYSIYVTYQLPATFNGFSSDDTVQLIARTDSLTNAAVTYQMYKSTGGAVTQCGTGETTVVTTANTWQSVGINGNESTGCSFTSSSAGNFVIFKVNMKANSNANAYVSTLSFVTTGR